MNLSEFIHMGGYAVYVWTSYGLTAVVLVWNVAVPVMQGRRLREELVQRERARRGK